MPNLDDLYNSVASFNEDKVKDLVKKYMDEEIPAIGILKSLQKGLVEIGNRYEKGDCFVPELMYGAEIVRSATKMLKPVLKGQTLETKGNVVLGTVFGDIHNIGKDLVKMVLEGAGFKVIDIGEDVNPEDFIKAIKDNDAKLVGLSALLTMTLDAITETVKAIKSSGLKDKTKVMIGGAPVTELVREKSGADFYGQDAFAAVKYAKIIYG
jgi:methylmalonyl-CoA mutase cobalamin-binding domain/chain